MRGVGGQGETGFIASERPGFKRVLCGQGVKRCEQNGNPQGGKQGIFVSFLFRLVKTFTFSILRLYYKVSFDWLQVASF